MRRAGDTGTKRSSGTTIETASSRRAKQRALMIGVTTAGSDELDELRELLLTAGVSAVGEMTQARTEPDPDRYFGKGKLEELRDEITRMGANLVACDDELAPRQERNLEAFLGVPVIDRTAIILDIFADHAHTAEGKLQVELAQLEYNLARMRGLWTHLERLGAGIGTRGPGESQIETDRRLARDRITKLRQRLNQVREGRARMRSERTASPHPQIALAGYTNAGKSSLMRALTGADVAVADRPFHTLDPTTRVFTRDGRRYILTDTVGFISKLPHQLVEAFRATLEETTLADLILHVVDASHGEEAMAREIAAADLILEEIGAGSKPRLIVLNKIDLVPDEVRTELRIARPDAVQVSALTGEGIDDLGRALEDAFLSSLETVELLVPYSEAGRLHDLHEVAGRLARDDRPEGVRVKAHLPASQVHRFADLAVG